jgi:carbonic anhydrase/acetyltransferase-like protein (isoleucine patch superfamily)
MRAHRRGGVRGWLTEKAKAKVRLWVTGPEIVHWDDPRQRMTWDTPTWPTLRTLESVRGSGAPVHVGAYSGVHYTVVVITGGQHHLDWVSLMHAHDEGGKWVVHENNVGDHGPVSIGSDCWVGFQAVIMSGITIGHGAAVAACAVVTKDVEPYAVVGGNPARHIRYRFDEPTRAALLRIAWWDWPTEKVAMHKDQIHSPDVSGFVAGHDPELGAPSCPLCA